MLQIVELKTEETYAVVRGLEAANSRPSGVFPRLSPTLSGSSNVNYGKSKR